MHLQMRFPRRRDEHFPRLFGRPAAVNGSPAQASRRHIERATPVGPEIGHAIQGLGRTRDDLKRILSKSDLDWIAPFDVSHEHSSSRATNCLELSSKTATWQYYNLDQSIRKYGRLRALREVSPQPMPQASPAESSKTASWSMTKTGVVADIRRRAGNLLVTGDPPCFVRGKTGAAREPFKTEYPVDLVDQPQFEMFPHWHSLLRCKPFRRSSRQWISRPACQFPPS